MSKLMVFSMLLNLKFDLAFPKRLSPLSCSSASEKRQYLGEAPLRVTESEGWQSYKGHSEESERHGWGSYEPIGFRALCGSVRCRTSAVEAELVLLKHVLSIAASCLALGMAF